MKQDETRWNQDPKTSAHRTRWRPAFRAGTGRVPAERFASETEICFVIFMASVVVSQKLWYGQFDSIILLRFRNWGCLRWGSCLLAWPCWPSVRCFTDWERSRHARDTDDPWQNPEWYGVVLAENQKSLAFPCTVTPCRIMHAASHSSSSQVQSDHLCHLCRSMFLMFLAGFYSKKWGTLAGLWSLRPRRRRTIVIIDHGSHQKWTWTG